MIGEIRDDNYRINTSIIKCDYIDLMENEKNLSHMSADKLLELANLCNGEYLMGRGYEWAYETKAYTETLSRRILDSLSDIYINENKFDNAIQILEKSLINDPCNEDNVEKLITLYLNDGQLPKAKAVYKTFAAKLEEQLGVLPSENIKKLINNK